MTAYLRPRIPGATIFFTVCLEHPGSDLLVREIDRLRAASIRTRQERPFEWEAVSVLPDRIICMWRLPEGDADYSTRWRVLKSRFSRGLPKGPLRDSQRHRQERGIWQRRFWEHHIRDAQDYRIHLRACWFAAVDAGLATHPRDWPFSSVHRDPRFSS